MSEAIEPAFPFLLAVVAAVLLYRIPGDRVGVVEDLVTVVIHRAELLHINDQIGASARTRRAVHETLLYHDCFYGVTMF